ncbi:MAG: hypothetical protein RHS_1794 [Robinsoniella sp. RHS]|uniref:hypothetical protein n=1 Tax=Robinsoniella sp. RHS TaxID=1504536 RepID=UPI000659F15D|nr:MAG: hypothetical protein RHS_1794 [Robinsoniella sp. RHS]
MNYQKIDGIEFKMGKEFDFSFLKKYGKVFKVFDDQDSGNICFGIESQGGRIFVKFAGAQTAEYDGDISKAIERLKSTVPVYDSIKHTSLIKYICSEEIGKGFAMIFEWQDGECMGRMYEESHRNIMSLPLDEKILIFQSIIDFLIDTAKMGYVAIDFYDGSIMYNRLNKTTNICDIDFFRKSPSSNDMGQMWGSARFMSPEEYKLGEILDEITNVFTIGQMGFSLFTDSERDKEGWPLSASSYNVLMKAISPDRMDRYISLAEFSECWNEAIKSSIAVRYI